MGERSLRSRAPNFSVNSSEPGALGLHTPESISPTQSGAINSNEANDMMPPEESKELQSKESQRGRKRATARQSHLARKKQKRDEIFDNLEAVLATHDSPLFKDNVNLKNIILHPKALAVLGDATSGYQNLESDTLSTAVASFKEDGACGHFTPDWLKEARAATEFRAAGQTAEYEDHMFNETWKTERETLTDEEDDGQSPQHNGDGNGDASCDDPSSDKIDAANGAVTVGDITGLDEKAPCGKMDLDSVKQEDGKTDLPTDPTRAQTAPDAPSEATEALKF